MPYTFRMILGGLCTFVPEPGLGAVRALMVNTDPQAGHGRVGQLSHLPDLHRPTLVYDRANETGANPASGSRQAIWPLRKEEITVTTQQPVPLRIVGNLSSTKTGTPAANDHDLDWIPNLASIVPLAGRIEQDCLGPNPTMDFITARVRIDQGTLQVYQFAQFPGTASVETEFVPYPTGATIARQAMPHQVRWDITVPDGQTVTINSRPFPAAAPLPIIAFGPAPAGGTIEVQLINLCCGQYLTQPPPPPPSRLDPDDDFECFYMLLDNFSTLINQVKPLPIPVPVAYPPMPVAGAGPAPNVFRGGIWGIKCSMSRAAAQ
jgi:hypothetical protein